MSKAQVSQAFIFIFMLIIIATVTIVAFRLMKPVKDAGCAGEISSMTASLGKLAKSYQDYGTVKFQKVSAPCNYEEICFISTEGAAISNSPSYFVINQYLTLAGSERDKNVFLIKDEQAEAKALIPEINIDPIQKVVCVKRLGGNFPLKFVGQGKYVYLSQGSSQ